MLARFQTQEIYGAVTQYADWYNRYDSTSVIYCQVSDILLQHIDAKLRLLLKVKSQFHLSPQSDTLRQTARFEIIYLFLFFTVVICFVSVKNNA